MSKPAGRSFKRDAEVLRALANESRLVIVDRLSRGECCVCDLVELVGSDQSTVSKHLALLRQSGVVEGRRRGNHIYYRLLTPCVLSLLSCAERVRGEREAAAELEAKVERETTDGRESVVERRSATEGRANGEHRGRCDTKGDR